MTFEEAWRLAWIREHRLPLGYTASVLSTYRAAGDRLISALDIGVSGARGRNLARVRASELSRSMGMPSTVSDSATESSLVDVTGVITAVEALGWETLDSPHGGIRIGLNQEAVAFHEYLARGEDVWLVWAEEGHWAWGTATSDGILASTTVLNTVASDNPKATAAALDAVLRGTA
ncbi:hypothetical protein OHA79_46155 (plasmid) [Streptomyces sp. NBC_00841]|uniref:hypothetical protein n=1 Tax=unclassified Streptomyces TaxID=2593676 RepID=UPI0022575045|nr:MULTISPECIES: hypothetical protein [unclassified Streptomyces]MCX4537820.1 hypothetical protein [Streptomyces sp. NBC_01669]WSA05020.1 hypothetical protein OHA79_46155 [Streptomyces sp. NBC_00841]